MTSLKNVNINVNNGTYWPKSSLQTRNLLQRPLTAVAERIQGISLSVRSQKITRDRTQHHVSTQTHQARWLCSLLWWPRVYPCASSLLTYDTDVTRLVQIFNAAHVHQSWALALKLEIDFCRPLKSLALLLWNCRLLWSPDALIKQEINKKPGQAFVR